MKYNISNNFKNAVMKELVHCDPCIEFEIKRAYFERFHCWFSDCNKYGVFVNEKVKLLTERQLKVKCGADFINKWIECDDKRTLEDPMQYGYKPDIKNREYCAKWRETHSEQWREINRTRAQARRDAIKLRNSCFTPKDLMSEMLVIL
jgi:hypothetical protein